MVFIAKLMEGGGRSPILIWSKNIYISSHPVRKKKNFFYRCKKKNILPLRKSPPPPITFLMVRPLGQTEELFPLIVRVKACLHKTEKGTFCRNRNAFHPGFSSPLYERWDETFAVMFIRTGQH